MCLSLSPVAVVGLEETFYHTGEGQGVVQVCAVVYMPDNTVSCPIAFEFTVYLSSAEFTAGIYIPLYSMYSIHAHIIPFNVSDTHGLWRSFGCSSCVPFL